MVIKAPFSYLCGETGEPECIHCKCMGNIVLGLFAILAHFTKGTALCEKILIRLSGSSGIVYNDGIDIDYRIKSLTSTNIRTDAPSLGFSSRTFENSFQRANVQLLQAYLQINSVFCL